MNFRLYAMGLALSSCVALTAVSRLAAASQGGAILIENTRVEVGDGTVLGDTSVYIVDGVIKGIYAKGKRPRSTDSATRIDGKGKTLTPGFIESLSQLGLKEVDAEELAVELNEEGPLVEPSFDPALAFNPRSVRIPIIRAGGVTRVLLTPEGGLLPGQMKAVALDGRLGTDPQAVAQAVQIAGGLKAAVGGSKAALWRRLSVFIEDARFYQKNKGRYDRGDSRPLSAHPREFEAFMPVLRGKMPLVIHVSKASDILVALAFAEKEGLKIVLSGVEEGWLVAKEIAKAGVPVLLRPSFQAPTSFDRLAARDDNLTLLHQAGVEVLITAAGWENNPRRLRQEAAIAVANGLPRDVALAAITQKPAQAFGLTAVGTIREGAAADLVLWSGDPLELSSQVENLWIAGIPQNLDNRWEALARRYKKALKTP